MLLLEFNEKYYNVEFIKLIQLNAPMVAKLIFDYFDKKGFKTSDRPTHKGSMAVYSRDNWYKYGLRFNLWKDQDIYLTILIKINGLYAIVDLAIRKKPNRKIKINLNNKSVKEVLNEILKNLKKMDKQNKVEYQNILNKNDFIDTINNVAIKKYGISIRRNQQYIYFNNLRVGEHFGDMRYFLMGSNNFDTVKSLKYLNSLFKFVIKRNKNSGLYLSGWGMGSTSYDHEAFLYFGYDKSLEKNEKGLYKEINERIENMRKINIYRKTIINFFKDISTQNMIIDKIKGRK